MDIESFLSDNSSREMVNILVQEANQDQKSFLKLYQLAFTNKKGIAWKAAWVLSHLSELNSALFYDKTEDLQELVLATQFDGVRRSVLYILSFGPVSKYSVEFINACFEWMLSPKQPIAIQVYCMRVLLNVCRQMPDFKAELQVCLENADPNDYSKGFAACRRNTLKTLAKLSD